ncbi:MAG: GNAT family N-acetyltransferase [Dehalococcoidia bacterium]
MTFTKLLQLTAGTRLANMSDRPYSIRNFRPDDIDSYVRLNVEAERLDPSGRCTSPEVLAQQLGGPNYRPEENLFVAETAGKVVAYADVRPELGIGRAVLDCLVHPEHRRRGLATRLFHHASRRAKELGARVAHVNIREDNVAAKALLAKLGFRFVRRFVELRLALTQAHALETEQIVLPCRCLQRGEEGKLTGIQNRAFADTWGYNPNTLEEIAYRLNLANCSPEDVLLIWEGDRPIGYCWMTIDPPGGPALDAKKGRIYMLGVDPDYRGKGVGRQMLLAGLAHLKSKGIEVAELTVDSENKEACALYESVGFRISATTAWYEKELA